MSLYQTVRGPDGAINAALILRLADGAAIPADEANIDWLDFQAWLADGNAPEPAPPLPDPVPETASAGDFMRALIELGWYGDVAAAVAALAASGTEDGLLARVLWERAATFERHHPLVSAIAQAIGKDEAGLDLLFRRTRTYR